MTVGVRPQDARIAREGEASVPGEVLVYENVLEFGLATVRVEGLDSSVVVQTPADLRYQRGEPLRLTAPAERVYLFEPEGGARLR